MALLLHKDDKALQKSDVAVGSRRKADRGRPEQPVVHTYRVFAGPKTADALHPYGADGPGLVSQEPVDPGSLRGSPGT